MYADIEWLRITVVLAACVAVWRIWSVVNKRLLRDAFSPLNLLLYCWVLPLLASNLQLSNLQLGLSNEAAILLAACTAVLISTACLPIFMLKRQPFVVRSFPSVLLLRRRIYWVLGFYVLTLTALYFAEFHNSPIPLIAYVMQEATSSTLHAIGKESKLQVLSFGIHVATMFVFILAVCTQSVPTRVALMTLVFFVVAVGFLKASKTDVYIPMLTCAVLLYYHRQQSSRRLSGIWRVTAIVLGAGLVLVTAVRIQGVGIQGGYADAISFKYSEALGPLLSEFVSIVYGYTSLAFENFSNFIARSDGDLRIGSSMFRPFLSMMMQGEAAESLGVPVEQWGVISDAANTGTFLTPLYMESGPGGCLLGSFLYGLLVNVTYIKFRERGGVWLFLYITMIFPWTWLFFANAFSVLAIYVNLFYAAIFFATSKGGSAAALVDAGTSTSRLRRISAYVYRSTKAGEL